MSSPDHIAVLRLSALGDVVNCLPAVRALQARYPHSRISWIIGNTEHSIVRDIPDIHWVVVNKRQLWQAWKTIHQYFAHHPADILLHMQAALRASILSTAVHAPVRVGFDRARSKDFQHWFCSDTLDATPRRHMVDTFLEFAVKAGAKTNTPYWDLPIAHYRQELETCPDLPPQFCLLSPCSSKAIRNIPVAVTAAVITGISEQFHLPVVVTGGTSAMEHAYSTTLTSLCPTPFHNMMGRTNIRQTLGLISNAQLVISPDSGPAHFGAALGVPVVGVYANTNPERAAPYGNTDYLVNRYPQAVAKFLHKDYQEVPFGTRVRHAEVMNLIQAEGILNMVRRVLDAMV
jgi:heptosyltransferase I